MQKHLARMVLILFILACAGTAQAYSYNFDVTGGSATVNVNSDSSVLSIASLSDFIVDLDFDPAPAGLPVAYSLSLDMNLVLAGFINYPMSMDNVALGLFEGIDPAAWIGDGTNATQITGTPTVSGAFGSYTLTDATLAYDVTFTPQPTPANRYAITIDTLSLSGGNTQMLLTGIIDDLNQSGEAPFTLTPPINLPIALTGTAELTASAVPVPAAVWLLGSGIIGLLGIRRRLNI